MKVLITGGLGFIGRAFAKRLLDDGHIVTIVDNMYSGVELADWMFKPNAYDPKTRSVQNLQLMIGDCRSFFASSGNIWSANRFDLVIHCAAIVGGRVKIEDHPLEVALDLAIDAEFFRWVVDRKPYPKVVYFSSSAVYPLELQTREKHVALAEAYVDLSTNRFSKPDMSYGWVKLTGEYLAKFASEKYGLHVVTYRPFGGYGEDQSKDYPFPSIIKRVTNGENPVVVWGSGDQERDFVHVDDVVETVLQTYDKLFPGRVINIGTGIATSFFSLAEQVVIAAGTDATVINDPKRPEGVFSRVADVANSHQYYVPKITLAEGIKRALARASGGLDRAKSNV